MPAVDAGRRLSRELSHLVRDSLWATVDFIFPNDCLLCGCRLSSPEDRICRACITGISRLEPPEGRLSLRLGDGASRALPYLAVWSYDDPLQTLIHTMKYRGVWKLTRHFSQAMAELIGGHPPFSCSDWLVPVPLHRVRLRERGFNQSLKLAKGISRITQQPVVEALRRRKNTRMQAALSAEERRRNVRDAFRVRSKVRVTGRRILLVDDVLTTGATAEACARVLLEAGAFEVRLAVVARA